jgi:ribosomal-protein-alanine N-acetyltransferase
MEKVFKGSECRVEFGKLESVRTILRRIEQTDLDDFLYYRSNSQVARYQYWEPFTRSEALEFIEKHKCAKPGIQGEWFPLGIVDKETNRLIGDCSIKIDAFEPRNAEVGCSISCDYQRRGIAAEVLTCFFAYAFCELKVHRISAITDCDNISCIKLLERLMMRREGRFVKNVWFKGNWGSEYIYAILEEEWKNKSRLGM